MTTTIEPRTEAKPSGISPEKLKRIIARHTFCTLATASADGKPHVVAIRYWFVNDHLYFVTGSVSKKARNIRENPRVAVCIPVPKAPFAPPYSVQFQGTATILSFDDPEIVALLQAGRLKRITLRGIMEKEPNGVFLKVRPARRVQTYGLGIPLLTLLRDVTKGDRTVILEND